MTLDESQDAFRANPQSHDAAQAYASELITYHRDEMIGNDTLRYGLIEIAQNLSDGCNDLGWAVGVTVKAI